MSFQDVMKCFQCGENPNAGGACGGSCSQYPRLNQQGSTSQFVASIGGIGYAPPNPQCINPALLQTSYFSSGGAAPIPNFASYIQQSPTYPQYANSNPQAGWNTHGENTAAWLEAYIQPGALNNIPLHNTQTSNTQPTNAILVSTTTTFPQDPQHHNVPSSPKASALTPSTAPQYGQTLSPLDLPPPQSAMPSPHAHPTMSGALQGHRRRRSSMTSVSSYAVLPDPQEKDAALQTLSVVCSAVSQSQLSYSDAGDMDMSPMTPLLRPLGRPRHGSPIPSKEHNTLRPGDVNLCHDCYEWFRSFVEKYRCDIRIILGTTTCENCMRNGKCDRNIASVPAIRIIPPAESVERMKSAVESTAAIQDIPATKSEYYCRVLSCNRAAGKGKFFSRNDNRNQHEWTVHKIPKPRRGQAGREDRERRDEVAVPQNGLGPPPSRPEQARSSGAMEEHIDNVPRKRRRRGARSCNK